MTATKVGYSQAQLALDVEFACTGNESFRNHTYGYIQRRRKQGAVDRIAFWQVLIDPVWGGYWNKSLCNILVEATPLETWAYWNLTRSLQIARRDTVEQSKKGK